MNIEDFLFMLYMILTTLDWVTTVYGIRKGCHETNDIMGFFFKLGPGWALLITFIATFFVGMCTFFFPNWWVGYIGYAILIGLNVVILINNFETLNKLNRRK